MKHIKENMKELKEVPREVYKDFINDFYNKHYDYESATTKRYATQLISMLKTTKIKHTARTLGLALNINAPEVRNVIQFIRKYSNKYLKKGQFLVAGHRGYWLSYDPKEIEVFLKKTLIRYKNTHAQINQMLLCVAGKDE